MSGPDPEDRWQTSRDLLSELRWVRAERDGGARTGRRTLVSLVSITAAAAIVIIAMMWRHQGPINSIAVLPIENASGDPDLEFLADGITRCDLGLSPIPGLKVMSEVSVFKFKGKTKDLPAIAKTLKVKALLVGRLEQRAGVLFSVEMIDGSDSRQLWGAHYTRTTAGTLGIADRHFP